jgi:hypothetical protein
MHVPYRGNGAALTAVISGEVSMAFDSAGGAVVNGKSDAYRVLAVTGGPPLAAYPSAPDLGSISATMCHNGTDCLHSPVRRPKSSTVSRRPCMTR